MKLRTTQAGYTLLFSVLIATLVLGVAVFILGISKKQFILAVTARESMFAIYNADSGIECSALAYSAANNTLATTSQGNASIPCNNQSPVPSAAWSSSGMFPITGVTEKSQTGHINIGFANGGCAYVVVTDGTDASGHLTIIDSRGYNIGDFDVNHNLTACPSTSSANASRIVERALRLTEHN
jgi:hypothetical protein